MTARYGVPNACTTCHDDKTPEWATKQMDAWWGDGERRQSSMADGGRHVPRRIGRHQRGAGPGADGGRSHARARCSAPARPTTSPHAAWRRSPLAAPSRARRRLAPVPRVVPPSRTRRSPPHRPSSTRLIGAAADPEAHGAGHGGQGAGGHRAGREGAAGADGPPDRSRRAWCGSARPRRLLALGIVELPGRGGAGAGARRRTSMLASLRRLP